MRGYPCGAVGEPCISGKPYFRPANNVTRGQSAKIVANAARLNEPIEGQTFSDVPPSHPFYEFIEAGGMRHYRRVLGRHLPARQQCIEGTGCQDRQHNVLS